ncbi:F-box protein CPR1-like [Daucus carota subsp. sativus]|uniref:F-box protein CPR1-like n=1 Tax=Daucus carota subsp. sativus TaxID=79200 RepID=UPI0007EF11BF|nr:PREDICTED: F-box protein CPR30-like [Daucus carota subsp. sativus]
MARRENCKKNNPELPHELMFKIFFLLPVATLLRCKSVCKTWLSIITNPNFVEAHCIESQKRQPSSVMEVARDHQIMIDNHETKTLLQLPTYFYGMTRFVSCCNGLVCFANHDSRIMFLGNPMTRGFKKLPTPRIIAAIPNWCKIGFGFDDVSRDYKIIRVVVDRKDTGFSVEAEMYSVNEDWWKEIRVPIGLETFRFVGSRGRGVFRPDKSRVLYFEGSPEILSFDLHDEVFRVHPFPRPAKLPLEDETIITSYLLESEGSVAMICDESSGDGNTVRSLWTLDRDCGNWTKQFNLEDHLKYNHIVNLYLGDGQFVVADYGCDRRPIFYYYKKGNAKEYLGASPARQLTSVVKCNESLVSLKGFKQI